jgi:hypothetical protein
MKRIALAAVAAVLLLPAVACAQRDVVTFGGDAHVRKGEVVQDVVTMGGDAHIAGTVLGDVVTMGGDLAIEPSGEVRGDLVTMGGEVMIAEGGAAHGERVAFDPAAPPVPPIPLHGGHHHHDGGIGGWIADALGGLVSYALLFVLGLLLMGVARERLDALQLVIVRKPLASLGLGVLGFIAAVVTIVVLAITIIGIPAAVVLACALPFAVYVALAAAASVIGAAIPSAKLKGRPVAQLFAGCAALYVASLVPFVGDVLVAVAAAMGVGALIKTRFGKATELPPEPTESGPYRTSVV